MKKIFNKKMNLFIKMMKLTVNMKFIKQSIISIKMNKSIKMKNLSIKIKFKLFKIRRIILLMNMIIFNIHKKII